MVVRNIRTSEDARQKNNENANRKLSNLEKENLLFQKGNIKKSNWFDTSDDSNEDVLLQMNQMEESQNQFIDKLLN